MYDWSEGKLPFKSEVNMADITTTEELKETYPELTDKIIKEVCGEDTESSVSVIKDKDGNITEWTEELRDSDGKLVSKRVDKYSFYLTGEVNIITQQVWDKDGKLTEKQIKHYTDGKPPSSTELLTPEPKGE